MKNYSRSFSKVSMKETDFSTRLAADVNRCAIAFRVVGDRAFDVCRREAAEEGANADLVRVEPAE